MKHVVPIFLFSLLSLASFSKDKVTITFMGDKIKESELGNGCISIECKPSSNICYSKVLDCPGGSTRSDYVILSELIIDGNFIPVNKELVAHEITNTENQTQIHNIYIK